ncbi:MAG TPA: ribosome assembly cofactor RimP [Puia sp.]|jgi:ribosome maturation factor RimP|nr:ribosome assembly cofactor RimP [Puia sp.]
MDKETQIESIRRMIEEILVEEPVYFLVDLRIKPINNIKVFLDGDSGITIEKCVQVNRKLYKKLEEAAFFPAGDFSLEVSSAGLDEPLKSLRQYKKNIGRLVEIQLQDGTQKEGQLTDVSEEGIVLEVSTGKPVNGKLPSKKKEISSHSFLFNNIKSTKIQIVF